jgi:4-hydroxyacetophenone monooxygenase
MTREFADGPITEDDASLAAALEYDSTATLLMAIVHLTGDASLLLGPIRPQRTLPDETDGGLSDADKAALHIMALDALRAYRDRGPALPSPSENDAFPRTLDPWLVGTPSPPACQRPWAADPLEIGSS